VDTGLFCQIMEAALRPFFTSVLQIPFIGEVIEPLIRSLLLGWLGCEVAA
jgi:hypothetical protein